MGIEFGELATMPSPPAMLTPEGVGVFQGEQSFVYRMALRRNREMTQLGLPVAETPFFHYLEDLSSTQMAQELADRYGLSMGRCLTNREIADDPKMSQSGLERITARRQALLYTLWELHTSDFPADIYPFAHIMQVQYRQPDENSGVRAHQFAVRGRHNLGYYQDREFLLDIEDPLLQKVRGLFGQRRLDAFARFYRLGEYKQSISYERAGNFSAEDMSERSLLYRSLDVGRATAEYLSGIEVGGRMWNLGWNQPRTVAAENINSFEENLAAYNRQSELAALIQDPAIAGVLSASEIELLRYSTDARLRGDHKEVGLKEFQEKHGWDYDGTYDSVIVALERKVLEAQSADNLMLFDRVECIQGILNDPEKRGKLTKQMLDILFDHEVDKKTAQEIGDDYGYERYIISEVAHFVRAILFYGAKKGQIRKERFEEVFATEQLPDRLLKALNLVSEYKRFNKGQDPKVAISQLTTPPATIHWWHLRSMRSFLIQFEKQQSLDNPR